jgi:hypothetical protein
MENHTYPLAYSEKNKRLFCHRDHTNYYGTDMIGDVFNMDGIIMLNENFNINDLTELYYNKIDAINDNYNRVINMPVAEDYIFENYIK